MADASYCRDCFAGQEAGSEEYGNPDNGGNPGRAILSASDHSDTTAVSKARTAEFTLAKDNAVRIRRANFVPPLRKQNRRRLFKRHTEENLKKRIVCAALAGVFWMPLAASAGVIYSNIGPGFPNDATTGWGAPVVGPYWGQEFTAMASGAVTSIATGAYTEANVTAATLGLYTSVAGQPGVLLESWNSGLTYYTYATTFTSVLNPILTAGSEYWVVLTETPGLNAQWTASDEGAVGGIGNGSALNALSLDTTDPALGIEIDGVTAAPEPATAGMIGAIGLALVLARRRRLG